MTSFTDKIFLAAVALMGSAITYKLFISFNLMWLLSAAFLLLSLILWMCLKMLNRLEERLLQEEANENKTETFQLET